MEKRLKNLLAAAAGAVTVLVLAGAAGGLVLRNDGIQFPDGSVQTTAAAVGPRVFYLTASEFTATQAPTACAPGFHFASLWEILDVSNLRYARSDEVTPPPQTGGADQGEGPPGASLQGWIRTGFNSSVAGEGRANCTSWSSPSLTDNGTVVSLEDLWSSATGSGTPSSVITPWDSELWSCGFPRRVWCVQN